MKLLFTLAMLVWGGSSTVFAQSFTDRAMVPIAEPTPVDRYMFDYEVQDYNFATDDHAVLFQIDLDYLESFRNPNEDTYVVDANTGLTVILYKEIHPNGTLENHPLVNIH